MYPPEWLRHLDALIEQKVFGHQVTPHPTAAEPWWVPNKDGGASFGRIARSFSTSGDLMILLLDTMQAQGLDYQLGYDSGDGVTGVDPNATPGHWCHAWMRHAECEIGQVNGQPSVQIAVCLIMLCALAEDDDPDEVLAGVLAELGPIN